MAVSPAQAQQIVDRLTTPDFPWSRDDEPTYDVIREVCGPEADVRAILEEIYIEQRLIRAISDSGGVITNENRREFASWKWEQLVQRIVPGDWPRAAEKLRRLGYDVVEQAGPSYDVTSPAGERNVYEPNDMVRLAWSFPEGSAR